MTDINSLIRLNVELEGLLKVLIDRDSIHARSLLAEKFREYSAGLQRYLDESSHTLAETETIVDRGRELAAEAHATEVKDQEAADSEVTDEATAAEAAIQQAQEPEAPAAEPEPEVYAAPVGDTAAVPAAYAESEPVENKKLLKAFTLNDKFRFRRELFNGDDEDFADTLSLLAHMPSYDEAVDYLTNDLLWDKRNPNVEDFFAILKENMPS